MAYSSDNRVFKQPCVFFDRDGVLNVDSGYVHRCEDFVWMPGAIDAVKFLNDRGVLAIVITNQSGIARKLYTEDDLHRLNSWIQSELAKNGAHLDGIYYCPHHPSEGDARYVQDCLCRKPRSGLLLKAIEDWKIDVTRSFLIGDRASDVTAAEAVGVRGILFDQTRHLNLLVETEFRKFERRDK